MKIDANKMQDIYDANGFLTAIDVLDEKELHQAQKEHAKLEEKFGRFTNDV